MCVQVLGPHRNTLQQHTTGVEPSARKLEWALIGMYSYSRATMRRRTLCTLLSDFNNIPMPELPNLSKDCIFIQHNQSLGLLLLFVPVLRHA